MNIKFKVGQKEYQLKGSSHDFILYEYNGTRKVTNKDTGEIMNRDDTKLIGYFDNPFRALSFIPDYAAKHSNVKNFESLKEFYEDVLKDLKEISNMYRLANVK